MKSGKFIQSMELSENLPSTSHSRGSINQENAYLLPPMRCFCCLTLLLPMLAFWAGAFLAAAPVAFFLAACSFFLALTFSAAAACLACLIWGFWAFLAWISAQDWEPAPRTVLTILLFLFLASISVMVPFLFFRL